MGSLSVGVCRFCGSADNTGILAIGNICGEAECQVCVTMISSVIKFMSNKKLSIDFAFFSQSYASTACSRILSCGHVCGGISNEVNCLPCLHGCHTTQATKRDVAMLKQDAEDMCMICFTEALSAAPAIQVREEGESE